MILDRLENWPRYFDADTRIARAFRWLQEGYDPAVTEGRVPVEGDDIFALPQGYTTKPLEKARFEAHRVYLDIQLVLRGAETIGWAPASELEIDVPYNPEKDILWHRAPALYTPAHVTAGCFALLYPEDAHAPGLRCPGAETVFKVVMKVRV